MENNKNKVGIFTVKKDLGSFKKEGQSKKYRWLLVECPRCGEEVEIRRDDAKRNKSCGCTRYSNPHNKTHGDSRTKLHFMWMNMIARVDKNEHYKDVSLCAEWREYILFKEFALSNGYKEGLSIDRINPDGDYEPKNVRFVPLSVQAKNRNGDKNRKRDLPKGVYYDKRKNKKKYFSSITVDGKAFHLGMFSTIKQAQNAYNSFIENNNLTDKYQLSI